MSKKPIFIALEPAHFEDSIKKKLQTYYDYTEYSSSFLDYCYVEVLYTRFARIIDRNFLANFPNCKFILCNATGIDHIDEHACIELGIRIISLRGETQFLETITATAELTWFLVLALARNAVSASQSVRSGIWNRDAFIGMQLQNKTLGIVGFGRNGRKLAKYGKAFEMNVVAYDPKIHEHQETRLCNSLGELCAVADIVCITATSNESTRRIFDASILSKFRSHALLVNSARGEIVDEEYILSLLKAQKIGGYATDVLTDEHNVQKNHLFQAAKYLDNLIITPHIGGVTKDSWYQTEQFVVERLLQILEY